MRDSIWVMKHSFYIAEILMQGYIYLIINKQNGNIYVGQTISLSDRWNEHKRTLNNCVHKNKHLQNAWSKYGPDNFEFRIAEEHEEISKEKLTEAELYWRDAYQFAGIHLYNIAEPGSTPMLGRKQTIEARAKISAAMKGNKHSLGYKQSKETRDKISKSLINNKRSLGFKQTEEHKVKISKALIGKVISTQHKENLSKALLGNTNCLGNKRSEETKIKISEAQKGYKPSEETILKLRAAWVRRKQRKS